PYPTLFRPVPTRVTRHADLAARMRQVRGDCVTARGIRSIPPAMSGTHAPHHHDHAHAHGGIPRSERRLLIAFVLTACMLVAEAIGGVLSGSLALLADAGHMLVDALALLFAWLGARFAQIGRAHV